MSNQTTIGELSINLKMRLEGIEKGIDAAKKKLQEIEQENKKVEGSNKNLEGSYLAMSAVAVASLMKIGSVIKGATEEYKAHTQAMSSLQNVASYTGENINELSDIMGEYENVMTKSDLATTIKNFTLMGFTAEQTEQMIEALTNSAIRNRNANYTVSEAVRVASEGYRQGLSTLSDSAGVTENLSVMLENYAQSIGKTASQLTEAEKNQAYLNRTMYAAEPFAGAMVDYMESLAGKQGEYSQAMRETQVAYSEALEPVLIKMEELKTNAIKTLGEFITENEVATSGVTAFGVAILSTGLIITAGIKGVQMYKAAIDALNVSSKALKGTMTGMFVFSAIVAGVSMYNTKMQEAIEKTKEQEEAAKSLEEALSHWNSDKEFTENEEDVVTQEKNKADEIIKIYDDTKNRIKQIKEEMEKTAFGGENANLQRYNSLNKELSQVQESMKDFEKANLSGGKTIDDYRKKSEELGKTLQENELKQKYLTQTNAKSHRETLVNIAQTKADIQGKQQLLDILKKGQTTTEEYTDAKNQLVKAYPELAKVNENTIASTQAMIDAENAAADAEWVNAQMAIQASILKVNAMMSNSEQIQTIANVTQQSVEQVTASLQNQMNVLSNLANLSPADFKGTVTSSYTPKVSKSSSSYSNKRLDNYKKEIEHKKALDQLSIQQEIQMYEYALKKYAKTTDEKRELREKIYELNKELAQKDKVLLDQQTEDYETYIQQQKNLRGSAYNIDEQTSDYNKIIQMHKSYLNQIMKDERLSLEERKEIYREELQIIRDYEQQKRDLRVEQIDNTVSQLTDAITKQLEEMQEKDKEMIDKNIEEIEKWKEIRINAINEEYDARIEAINKELEALDKAEQEKSRAKEDAEYESKKKRLEELVAYEHDATTKANYQKELDKLIAGYQKTLDERALEDKKEALNAQKELLQEEQDHQVQIVEDEVEKQKEIYNEQLENLEKYYDEQIEKAQETAENMLLNVEQNQNQILSLLQSYGDAYEITGQSLGEKLAQGINEGIASKIENIISKVQSTIDAGIEAQIAKMASSVYKYEVGTNKPQTTSINITQQNYIEQNPEMPSETYRKLNNVSQNLAAEFAGM